jgi:cytochrome c oxidase subunit 2
MKMNRLGLGLGLLATLAATAVCAQPAGEPRDLPIVGAPVPGGVNYQPAVTPVAHDMHWLSHWVHGIMLVIVIFVVALIAIVIFRYSSRSNPRPAMFTHNTRVEIAWTLIPVVILILIGSFSLPILFKQLEVPTPDLTIKATGNQWYWSYTYPENEVSFDSLLLGREDLEAYGYTPDLYLLATDTAIVVPVDKTVHMLVTGADVIHAWTIPAFGVKIDAVPGRLNETWFRAEEEGVYFGQCSELCGKNHAYMPITVKVVSQEAYDAWLDWAIDEYGGVRPEPAPAGGAAAAEPPAGAAPAEAPAVAPDVAAPGEPAPTGEGVAPEVPAAEVPPEPATNAPSTDVAPGTPPVSGQTEDAPAGDTPPAN